MRIAGHDIAVCSWSVRAAGMADLVKLVRGLGLEHVQLNLGPLLVQDEQARQRELAILRDGGLKLTAGMIGYAGENYSSIAAIGETGGLVPDADWPARRDVTIAAGAMAAQLGLRAISTHIGFIPASSHPNYATLIQRTCDVARPLQDNGVELLLETGQEQANLLLQFLNDLSCANVAVNFDPANMILYGAGDPFDAIRILGRHIHHVHVKDAKMSDQPGVKWGEETPFGAGRVLPGEFLAALGGVGYTGPLAIEREGGSDRLSDIRRAIESLRQAGG